jgi:murein DD-endopeptidase MepM/ murein hydrolase activator NlpD
MRIATVLPILLLAVALPASPAAEDSRLEATARELLANFSAGHYDAAAKDFDATMLAGLPPEKLAAFGTQLTAQAGRFKSIVEVKHVTTGGYRVVILVSDYERARLDVQVAFDGEGKVGGLFFKPSGVAPVAAATRFSDYVTKTRLTLPFDGEWYVFWGGRTVEENYHAVTVDQRFAYDILVMRKGVTHPAGGKANSDYYCFDQPIHAPAAGVVTESVDGIEDNVPGVMNPAAPAGNHLVIDHGNGEYSLLAHFRRGTVTVHTGDHVKAGQLLGKCGNSGNSSEPHLHYHLQNTPKFGGSEGLPAQFHDYCADGKHVDRGEPHKGQTISTCGGTK